jgi:hypothetical protein
METSAYDKSDSDEWTEDENFHERLTGNTDTVLQSADFREFNQILFLAPGEPVLLDLTITVSSFSSSVGVPTHKLSTTIPSL